MTKMKNECLQPGMLENGGNFFISKYEKKQIEPIVNE